jgi:DNA polymerase V
MPPSRWIARNFIFCGYISAGFPSPAEGFEDDSLDLHAHIVRNPAATYYYRVQGDDLRDECIQDGSILVVDRSINPRPGRLAVVEEDGAFFVERITRKPCTVFGCITAIVYRVK